MTEECKCKYYELLMKHGTDIHLIKTSLAKLENNIEDLKGRYEVVKNETKSSRPKQSKKR